MPIPIECPACRSNYRVDDKLAGKKVKCKTCGTPISVVAPPPQQSPVLITELDFVRTPSNSNDETAVPTLAPPATSPPRAHPPGISPPPAPLPD